jgi:hypothetical protein
VCRAGERNVAREHQHVPYGADTGDHAIGPGDDLGGHFPFEIASLFVAMAQGEWSMRLGTGMLDELTDKMIEDHA